MERKDRTSLETDERSEEGYGSSQGKPSEEADFLSNALRRAKGSSCPRCQGFFVVSATTGNAFEMSCKSWSCPHCSLQRKAVASHLIHEGIRRAQARGDRVRFLTLTAPSKGMTLREISEAWNRLMATLRPSGEISDYLVVIESGSGARAGVPHLHALAVGKFIPQERLSTLAARCAFGPVCHITAVDEDHHGDAGAYMGKQLATELVGYLAKGEAARLDEGDEGEKRRQIRPVRMSRNWYVGGMAAAEKVVKAEMRERMGIDNEARDPGPWFMVAKRWDGGLSVISRPKAVEPAETADEGGASGSGAPTEEDGELVRTGGGRE